MIISKNQLMALIILVLPLSSCVNGSGVDCVLSTSVIPQLLDSSGTILSDSLLDNAKAYLYLNSKFSQIVTADSLGRYDIDFSESDKTTLVVFGNMNSDSVNVSTPNKDDDISNTSLSLLSSTKGISYACPSNLFYGEYEFTSSDSKGSEKVVLDMYNKRATLRIAINNLQKYYGEGSNSLSGIWWQCCR